ncbi:unnamed protein product [Gadus morhua 'NCC']
MAEFSIDQKKLPPVKDVCRDFAVLEDHCLAHNLQEQEIESHLASNVHKSRLAQHDLKVAKLLQEEEDMRAKAQSKRQFRDLERQDNEIAQGIQEELVRQAEQQILQEEKDMAIARKMQEKEMKEERKRQKKLEANFEEEYFEDEGGRIVHRAGGTVIAGQEYGLSDATQGLTRLDLRDQEVIDMEVARRLQEEEILASNKDKHAAQVAQDEEIARLLAEQEKKEYKKIKEKERMMMDRMAQDKKRQEAGLRPHAEDVVRPRDAGRPRDDHGGPRPREELEHHRQRNHNKPTRPPQPRTPNYENVNPGPPYGYSDNPFPPRGNTRPEAAYKVAEHRARPKERALGPEL